MLRRVVVALSASVLLAFPAASVAHQHRTRAGDLRWGHKQHMKALRRLRASATPYGRWAIPSPIVGCESRYQNLPPNGAGASGFYQIIPGTWLSNGGGRYASQAYEAPKWAQDIVAHFIWTHDGPTQWDCSRMVRW